MYFLVAFLAGFLASRLVSGRRRPGSVAAGSVKLSFPLTWSARDVVSVLDRASAMTQCDGSVDVDLSDLHRPDPPQERRRPMGFHAR